MKVKGCVAGVEIFFARKKILPPCPFTFAHGISLMAKGCNTSVAPLCLRGERVEKFLRVKGAFFKKLLVGSAEPKHSFFCARYQKNYNFFRIAYNVVRCPKGHWVRHRKSKGPIGHKGVRIKKILAPFFASTP